MRKITLILLALLLALSLTAAQAETVTRTFDASLDRMMEDFSIEADAVEPAYLSVSFDDNCKTADEAVYKAASAGLEGQSGIENITLVLRGDAKLSDLLFGFRMNDTTPVKFVEFEELLDPDYEPMPELTADWQTYMINLLALDATYDDGSIVKPGAICGFHIVAKDGAKGQIDVLSVKVDETVLDDFSTREDVNKAPKSLYWCGSQTGVIVPRHLALADSEYVVFYAEETSNNKDGKYEYLAVTAKGAGALTVNDVAYEGLTDQYQSIVLPLPDKAIDTVYLKATGAVDVKNVFFTNLDEAALEVETAYPRLDASNILYFDNYDYVQAAIPTEWISEEPTAVAAGMSYIVSYHNADKLSVDGALVFDATSLDANDYINYKACTTRNSAGKYQYLVLDLKAEDGATLDGFRMAAATDDAYGDIIWANAFLSGAGLPAGKIGDAAYPYAREDGSVLLIIDMQRVFGITDLNGLDMYYSGTGKLNINGIFFANRIADAIVERDNQIALFDGSIEGFWWTDNYNCEVKDGEINLNFVGDWAKFRGATPSNNKDMQLPILAVEMKASEGVTLETLRLRGNEDSEEYVYWNQGKLVDPNGNALPALTTEYQTYYIDLAKSGLNVATEGIEIAFGGWADGSVQIRKIYYCERVVKPAQGREITLFDGNVDGWWWTDLLNCKIENASATLDFNADWAKFRGANPVNNKDAQLPYLEIVMSSIDDATLETLRLRGNEDSEEYVYWNQGKIVSIYGGKLPDMSAEDQAFIIDLNKSGLNVATEGIEIAFGGWQTGSVNIKSIRYFDTQPAYAEILAAIK